MEAPALAQAPLVNGKSFNYSTPERYIEPFDHDTFVRIRLSHPVFSVVQNVQEK
jgi:hypothetical protein